MIHATVGLRQRVPQMGINAGCGIGAFGPDAVTRDLKTDGHATGGDFHPD